MARAIFFNTTHACNTSRAAFPSPFLRSLPDFDEANLEHQRLFAVHRHLAALPEIRRLRQQPVPVHESHQCVISACQAAVCVHAPGIAECRRDERTPLLSRPHAGQQLLQAGNQRRLAQLRNLWRAVPAADAACNRCVDEIPISTAERVVELYVVSRLRLLPTARNERRSLSCVYVGGNARPARTAHLPWLISS